jgi:hypothetical protein
MICPICNKGELKEQIFLKGIILKRKEVMAYCPICNFSKVTKMRLSMEDYKNEVDRMDFNKTLELQGVINTKKDIKIKDTKFKHEFRRR